MRLQEVSKSKKHNSFQNFSEVVDALKAEQKGKASLMSKEKMVDLIDRWNG